MGTMVESMSGLLESGAIGGPLAFAVCFAALCFVLWLWGRWLGRAPAAEPGVPAGSVTSSDEVVVLDPAPAGRVLLFQTPSPQPEFDFAGGAHEKAVVAPAVRRRPRPAWELAEEGQTPASLLARAHEHLAAGAHDEAADLLRACARLASKLKEVGIEAVARLELGDLARSHGDMTTACEHWQLARSLYAELKRVDEVTAAVKRMEKAGCPTDWVLTKF